MKRTIEQKEQELPRLLNFKEVRRLTGLSRATVWRLERDGLFPRRRQVTATKVAWVLQEILNFIRSRAIVGAEVTPTHNLPESKPQDNQAQTTPVRRTTSWLDRDDD